MDSDLQTALFVIWAVGFLVTLWAGATDRFRLEPYGLPRPLPAILGQSVLNAVCTLAWFVYVPSWFVYRWTIHGKRTNA